MTAARAAGRALRTESTGARLRTREAVCSRVDVEAVAAEKPDQRLAELARKRDRQARRRPHGCEDRDARPDRLLHDLVAGPTAHDQDRIAQRQPRIQEGPADDLVDRIVAADVLAEVDELATRREQAGGVETSGPLEHSLARAEAIDEAGEDRAVDH